MTGESKFVTTENDAESFVVYKAIHGNFKVGDRVKNTSHYLHSSETVVKLPFGAEGVITEYNPLSYAWPWHVVFDDPDLKADQTDGWLMSKDEIELVSKENKDVDDVSAD